MKVLLSYGGGVNSTALLLKIATQECWKQHEVRVIFSDVHAEWPETKEYVDTYVIPFCQDRGYPFIYCGGFQNYRGLIDYCKQYNFVPSRQMRWCTDKFKIRPVHRYMKKWLPDLQLIGFDAGESHRAEKRTENKIRLPKEDRDGPDEEGKKDDGWRIVPNGFPLVDGDIDREGCVRIIKNHGWPVPIKSGCFFCPYQRRIQWYWLKEKHPELFQIAVELERASHAEHDKNFYLASNAREPLDSYMEGYKPKLKADQVSLGLDPDNDIPCMCGL